jgi:hypothetical protein
MCRADACWQRADCRNYDTSKLSKPMPWRMGMAPMGLVTGS